MNILKYNKVLSIISFILFIISGIFLFVFLHNSIVQTETGAEDGNGGIYILFAIQFFMGIMMFTLTAGKKEKIVEVVKHIKEQNDDNHSAEETVESGTMQENEKSLVNYDEIVDSLIPSSEFLSDREKYCEKLLTNLSKKFEIVQGVVFLIHVDEEIYHPAGKYAYFNEEPPKPFKTGETLPGQVARNKQLILIDDIPEGYVKVVSGLGTSSPKHLLIIPVLNDDKVIGILEIASFKTFDEEMIAAMEKLSEKLNSSFTSLIKE